MAFQAAHRLCWSEVGILFPASLDTDPFWVLRTPLAGRFYRLPAGQGLSRVLGSMKLGGRQNRSAEVTLYLRSSSLCRCSNSASFFCSKGVRSPSVISFTKSSSLRWFFSRSCLICSRPTDCSVCTAVQQAEKAAQSSARCFQMVTQGVEDQGFQLGRPADLSAHCG